jgi:hypothetical protein
MDDFEDDYDGGDDFTDEAPADEEPVEIEIEATELKECGGLGWEEIAIFCALSEQIADEEREMKKDEDEENI